MIDPWDLITHEINDQFAIGDSVLVAPVLNKGIKTLLFAQLVIAIYNLDTCYLHSYIEIEMIILAFSVSILAIFLSFPLRLIYFALWVYLTFNIKTLSSLFVL